MRSFETATERAARGLARNCELDPAALDAISGLDLCREYYPIGALVAAPREPPHLVWLVDGFACEARELRDGRRQICALALPGDVVRPPAPSTGRTLRALTMIECIDVSELVAPGVTTDEISAALAQSISLAASRRYEHLSRLLCRSPMARMASLIIEVHDRLEAVGLVRNGEFPLPLRHEDLADALGLSTLHVTRCVKRLRELDLATIRFRRVSEFDRAGFVDLVERSSPGLVQA